MIKLIDYVKVLPDPSLYKLSKKDKIELIDSSIDPYKKGLIITYDLSHSSRRINNRIYSIRGQQNGIKSLLTPYPKPILQHHDIGRDPIGRFIGGKWEDLSNQAIRFFNNLGDFMQFKEAMATENPEIMYQAMKKYNLLSNKDWPGLGRMRVTAKITDKEAVEKFLDGRYITFSAGSTTDKHVCSICNSDWAENDICTHRHGKIYDGETCVFFTGDFKVLEGSVVNTPADDLSQIQSMEFLSDSNNDVSIKDIELDESYIYLSDSVLKCESNEMNLEVSMKKDETSVDDNLDTDKSLETEVSQEEPAEEINISDSVMEKIYNYVSEKIKGESNENEKKVESKDTGEVFKAKDSEGNEIQEENRSNGSEVSRIQTDLQNGKESEKQVEVGNVDGNISDLIENKDVEIDWYLLDLAFETEIGDKRLSSEERNELPDSVFCGPERSFPVPDCAHVTAARRLIGRAKLSEEQKTKVLSCVDKRAKSMSCDSSIEDKLDSLTAKIEQQLKELKDKLAGLTKEEVKVEEIVEEVKASDNLTLIENPSVGSSDESSPTDSIQNKKLGSYEQQIVKTYSKIFEDNGEYAAESYFATQSRYLPKGFHPKKYLS